MTVQNFGDLHITLSYLSPKSRRASSIIEPVTRTTMTAADTKNATSKKKSGNWQLLESSPFKRGFRALAFFACIFALILQRQFSYSGDPFLFFFPNLLLFTPFRGTTKTLWNILVKYDKSQRKRDPTPIPEMDAKDYTYENLREMTNSFRSPAVIRGIFNGTPALKRWLEPGYLSSKALGDLEVPVIVNATYGTRQNQREVMKFGEAYEEILRNEKSPYYLFFPVMSREHMSGSGAGKLQRLREETNKVIKEDLELFRIFQGFGEKNHSIYVGGQLILGRGQDDSEAGARTTGTGWHCAPGNNWFAQVAGRKRWFFLDPKYSAYLQPLRNGVRSMETGTPHMAELQQYLPVQYADLEAGDLLYNPDWQWHTIKNYEGLSIGVPMREVIPRVAARNNAQYTAIVFINIFLEKFFGIIYGMAP